MAFSKLAEKLQTIKVQEIWFGYKSLAFQMKEPWVRDYQ